MTRFDGKYEILNPVLEGSGTDFTLSEAQDQQGQAVLLMVMNVQTAEQRNLFHKYRAALKSVVSPYLIDVVARPGAYYSVWKPAKAATLEEYMGNPRKGEATNAAVRDMVGRLELAGFAVSDARVVIDLGVPQLAGLSPVGREPEAIADLNKITLATLEQGSVGRTIPKANPIAAAHKPMGWGLRFLLGVFPGVLFLGGASYMFYQAIDYHINPKILSVPGVLGLEGKAAAYKLRDAGFRVTLINGEETNKRVGSVIDQDPAPDSTLHADRLVRVTVNHPPPLTVPKVSELSLDAAKTILKEAGLQVGNISYSYTGALRLPKGEVVGQYPQDGTQVARGSKVQILISKGVRPRMTFIPDLKGENFEDAKTYIHQAGLVLVAAVPVDSNQPEGTVLSQKPAPFEKIRVGEAVRLEVARVGRGTPPVNTKSALPLAQIVKPKPPPPPVVDPVVTDPNSTPATDPTTNPVTNPVTDPNAGTVPDPRTTTPQTDPNAGTVPDPRTTTPKTDPPKTDPPKTDPPKTDPPKTDPPKTDPPKTDPPKTDPPKTGTETVPSPGVPDTLPGTTATPNPSALRTINFMYTFPADLPAGTAELKVKDQSGEQSLLTQNDAAGMSVQVEVKVTGNATFTVLVNGASYTAFSR
jgi:beta-lactam-binding protein with PASTA domain